MDHLVHATKPRMLLCALVGALLVTFANAPTAAAHECTAEKGEPGEPDCSSPCTAGKDHDHRVTHHHENGIGEDYNHVHYSCSSGEEHDKKECATPEVLEICPISKAKRALGMQVGLV